MTWFRVPLACLVFALVLAPFAAKGAAPGACPGVSDRGDWTTIQGPEFPATEPAQISAYAVHPYVPDMILVTNGRSVMVTENGGCTWLPFFTFDLVRDLGLEIVGPMATIHSIVIPEHRPTKDDKTPVFLLVEEQIGGTASRPHVIVTRDYGQTWENASAGLGPLTGTLIRMRAAPSDPDTLYLLASPPGGGGEIYATNDGGTTWERRGDVLISSDFKIDPLVPEELWLSGPGGIWHSLDGGRSVIEVPYVSNPATFVDVFRASPNAPSRIIAQESETWAQLRSDDGGKTWVRTQMMQTNALSIAHGSGTNDVIVSSHEGVHRFRAPHFWIDITEDTEDDEIYQDIHDLQVDRTSAPQVFGFTPTAIKRYNGFAIELPPLISGKVPEVTDAAIAASDSVLHLEPGESQVVDYKLSLPPSPTPLDVYFLLDTTDSMTSSIKGLTAGIHRIAQDLATSKVDVRFGLGEYKDYPIAGYGDPVAGDFPYRQRRDLGPADDELVRALESLVASGGGRAHLPESQLTALFQSATGDGEPGFVDPGQEASFRSDALKVFVNITDAAFENSPAHPSPPFDDVADELRGKGILQIGLGVYGPQGSDAAMNWLTQMADATDTVAPAGVDCDADGTVDIGAGDPLVCEITDQEADGVEALAPAIIATLRALVDRADVALVPLSGGDLIEVAPPTYSGVDVKVPNILDFDGTVTCPETGAGGVIDLVATVAGETVAGTQTKVVCEPVKPEKVVPAEEEDPPVVIVPPAPAPQVAVAAAAPPPPPPAPVTQTQLQPNPHLQGALAQQEQDQVQAAFATSFDTTSETEYAFSTYSRRSRGPGAGTMLYMSAFVMTAAAAGFALRHRLRPVLARVAGRRV